MRTCNRCGKTKPLHEFVTDPKYKHGHRPFCRVCKSKEQAKQRVAARLRDKQKALLEAAARQEADSKAQKGESLIVPPRTYTNMAVPYVPDTQVYYRNNGNKHIPSRGF